MTERTARPTSVNSWAAGAPGAQGPAASTSPYGRTAFDVLDMPVEPVGRSEFVTRVRRRVTRARAGRARVNGVRVSEADVRAAARLLENPPDRTAQRLITHHPHRERLDTADLRTRLADLAPVPAAPDGPLLDRARLAGLLDAPEGDGDG